MSIVASYTREQWEAQGEWRGVEPYVDGVVLLFREEDYPEDDVMPVITRIDPATWQPWPEDNKPLPDVTYRYYTRDDENSKCWFLDDEGADQRAHSKLVCTPFKQTAMNQTAGMEAL